MVMLLVRGGVVVVQGDGVVISGESVVCGVVVVVCSDGGVGAHVCCFLSFR